TQRADFCSISGMDRASKWAKSRCQALMGRPCKNLQLTLDFPVKRISIELSPPIQFRIEWADSQGMSPLLGCRPILILRIPVDVAPSHKTAPFLYLTRKAFIFLRTEAGASTSKSTRPSL